MNKRAILKKITDKLVGELEVYFRAAEYARDEATHEQNKAENKYDTRGLEASYLARGQSKQAAELEAAIVEFEKLGAKNSASGDAIVVGALVELEQLGEKNFTSSARALAAPRSSTTGKKSSSSLRNRRWANNSWAKNPAVRFN